jgi:hypothetical protein
VARAARPAVAVERLVEEQPLPFGNRVRRRRWRRWGAGGEDGGGEDERRGDRDARSAWLVVHETHLGERNDPRTPG